MKQHRDSQKPIALIQRYSEGPVAPEMIQVVPTGKWDHHGEMEINSAAIAQFVENFKAKVRLKIPITAGHDTGMGGGQFGELPAIGWFTELVDRGVNGLWGAVQWTKEGTDLIAQGAFKYFSPEFYETYTDPQTQEKYEHVLVGGALTNKPYFKELEPVAFAFSEPSIMNQYNHSIMDLKKIVLKKLSELSTEEKAFLIEHKAELNDAQKKTFEEVIETPEEKTAREAAEKEAADKVAADKAAADVAAEAERQASEGKGKVTMSEAEAAILRDKADKGAKAFAELEGMKADRKAEKLLFSVTNAEGRFLPKQEVALKTFVRSLSESQRDQFATLVNGMPKSALNFKELGDGGKTDNDVVAELNAAVKVKETEGKMKYSEALKVVLKEQPELAKRYQAHMSGQEE